MIDPPVGKRGAMTKIADDRWGSEDAYFAKPPASVPGDAQWVSILFFYVLLPLNIVMALIATFVDPLFRWISSVAKYSALNGRPLILAWAWWWYQVAAALRLLLRSGKSRFTFFEASRALFGGEDWWWHGEGAWNCPYASVRETMASDQTRAPAFGAVSTCVPELFPADMLLFLDGQKWKTVRGLIESQLTTEENWGPRVDKLPELLARLAPSPCTLKTLDKPTCDKMVATAVWYLVFGAELSEEQATTVGQWGASGLAGYFIFPRMIHRIAFNRLLARVTSLRKDTLAVFTALGLQERAVELNSMLGPHARPSALAFADELMYAVNFAGVGGTQHGCWGTLSFLQRRTIDVPPASVTFPHESMVALYRARPDAFIKECVRLDAPVTSATCVFATPTSVDFNNSCCAAAPRGHSLPEGTLHQYVLSIANRDESKFPSPSTFDPTRANLDDMLGWNGQLSAPAEYPRICPGRDMSIAIIRAVVGLVEEVQGLGA